MNNSAVDKETLEVNPSPPPSLKILYIAGYGRSGSTILDIILSNHPQIVGLGEVSFLITEYLTPETACACGHTYDACAFWQSLFKEPLPFLELAEIIRSVERFSFLPKWFLPAWSKHQKQAYGDFHKGLFTHVQGQSHTLIIVDSSKTSHTVAWRILALNKLAGCEVYVLHLVRNGLSNLGSMVVTGSNRTLEGRQAPPRLAAIRTVLGWVAANLLAMVNGFLVGQYLRIRYEDLLDRPTDHLRQISDFMGIDLTGLMERIEADLPFETQHQVAGNRVRLQKSIRLSKNSQGKFALRLVHRWLFYGVAGWLNYLLGY